MVSPLSLSFFTFFLFLFLSHHQAQAQSDPQSPTNDPPTVCIIGSGISGSSVAHFLRLYSSSSSSNSNPFSIHIFERNGVVGGRMAMVNVSGQTFEAGASILHPKNYYAVNYTQLLGLKNKDPPSDSFSLGIWDGQKFVFKTHSFSSNIPFVDKIVSLANPLLMFVRYGFSILKMQTFVEGTVNNFLKYYERFESRPVFETVDEMLKWAGLYNLTTRTLQEELIDVGLSPLLIKELVTIQQNYFFGT
uniref:Prenylcysteine lyase domain-containing protein n=1 Tax=Quercus lobata TaxID=97700 RepID=A0A7N2MQ38_QUELO